MTPDELLAAVRQSIGDTDRIARGACGRWDGGTRWSDGGQVRGVHPIGDGVGDIVAYDVPIGGHRKHIVRHDPKAVLRRVAADREILDLHFEVDRAGREDEWRYCRTCGSGEPYEYPTRWPCATLLALARGYGIDCNEGTVSDAS